MSNMRKAKSSVHEDKSGVPHNLSAEEIVELKALLEASQKAIKTINSPLQIAILSYMLTSAIKYAQRAVSLHLHSL